MAAKKQAPKTPKAPATQEPAIAENNPATDPNATAQERLDALTKQQEEMNPAE